MISPPVPWQEVATRLRPFVARRVEPHDVDDVLQDVFLKMQRGLGGLRDDDRFIGWILRIAQAAVADHGRARARHPLPRDSAAAEAAAEPAGPAPDVTDGDATAHALAGCVAVFVARLPSPYREAVTLVELEGMTAREAAALAGVSVSGMKSRVQRGRARLRELFEQCCEIALDARGKPIDARPRACRGCADH